MTRIRNFWSWQEQVSYALKSAVSSRGVWLALALVVQFVLTTNAYCQAGQPVVTQHQRCVLRAFLLEADKASDYDPTLLDKTIVDCEKVLAPLKKSIAARTADNAFAERMLEKIRGASKRGVAIALLGFLEGRKAQRPGLAQPNQGASLLDQMTAPAKPVPPAAGGGMLDSIDPNASGIHVLGGKP
jgi:hypothetical protein